MADALPRFLSGKELGRALIDAGIIRREDFVTQVTIVAPVDGKARVIVEHLADERILGVLGGGQGGS